MRDMEQNKALHTVSLEEKQRIYSNMETEFLSQRELMEKYCLYNSEKLKSFYLECQKIKDNFDRLSSNLSQKTIWLDQLHDQIQLIFSSKINALAYEKQKRMEKDHIISSLRRDLSSLEGAIESKENLLSDSQRELLLKDYKNQELLNEIQYQKLELEAIIREKQDLVLVVEALKEESEKEKISLKNDLELKIESIGDLNAKLKGSNSKIDRLQVDLEVKNATILRLDDNLKSAKINFMQKATDLENILLDKEEQINAMKDEINKSNSSNEKICSIIQRNMQEINIHINKYLPFMNHILSYILDKEEQVDKVLKAVEFVKSEGCKENNRLTSMIVDLKREMEYREKIIEEQNEELECKLVNLKHSEI